MKRRAWTIGILLLAIAIAAACPRRGGPPRSVESATTAYRLVLERGFPGLAVRVEIETAGADSGFTDFAVEREWGGVTTGGDELTDARATGADGRELVVEHSLSADRRRVLHAAGERIRFYYRIAANAHRQNRSPAEHRRPLMEEGLFHAYGHLFLAVPSSWPETRRDKVAFVWDGFDAAGWNTASSFGVGSARQVVELTPNEMVESVWLAGEFEFLRRDIAGRPLWTAVAGREWSFRPADLADVAARIVRMEREFFADLDHPFFLITLVPVGEPGTGSRSIGGTGLRNSFALQMLPDTPLGGDFGRGMTVPALLAHEMFHFWDGHTIRPKDPEQLVYWFTEGFTDYYTRRLLYRDGLITLDEYTRSVSQRLADLWTSEVREAPNERIEADFWTHDAVKRLPYLRGDVVAMVVDHGIRRASNGARSLDDLMRELVREARAGGGRVGTDDLLSKFETWAGPDVAAHIRRIVVEGALPALDPATFAPCLELHTSETAPFALGFDFAASRSTGVVQGVVPGSNAAAAGLRDGLKLTKWSVASGDISKPVVLEVEDENGKRDIRYEPRGTPVVAPQVRVVRESTERCAGL